MKLDVVVRPWFIVPLDHPELIKNMDIVVNHGHFQSLRMMPIGLFPVAWWHSSKMKSAMSQGFSHADCRACPYTGVKGGPLNHWSKWGWLKTYCPNNPNPIGFNFGKMNLFHGFDSSTRVVLVQGYGMNMARKSACGFHCIGIVITIWYECCIPCPQYQRYRNSIKIIARPYQIHIGKPSWNTYI